MKLHGVIEMRVAGEKVLRQPRFWDKLKQRFGAEPDLATGNMRASLEAQAIVEAARQAFRSLGVNNAVSLVIDDQVLFQDRDGKPDDLGDMFLAFHDNAPVFGTNFRMLRLAVEHREAGLHYVAEIIARTEHPEDQAAARVVISARLEELEPKSGESAESYRARVEPLVSAPARMEPHRRQFETFVHRVELALRTAMPEARIETRSAGTQVEKPSTRPAKKQPAAQNPDHPGYDPYASYYHSPLDGVLSIMMWSSIMSMGMHGFGPDVVVVDSDGTQVDAAADDGGGGGDDWGGGGDAETGGDVGGDFGDF